MKKTVYFRTCKICRRTIGCYDSTNIPLFRGCKICTDICPIPTSNPTELFCDQHFNGEMQRLIHRRVL